MFNQLKNIEQAADAYFNEAIDKQDKKVSGWRPGMQPQGFGFDDLNEGDKKRYSEISQNLATVVSQTFDVIETSSLFDESDRQALRDGLRRADAALRFRHYRRWDLFVEHDEGTVLGVVPAGQAEDPIFSVPHAREESDKGLDAIKRILIRIPATVGKDAPQTELKRITRLTASKIAAEHNYSGKDITAICIAVACKEKGITDRIRVARNLKRGAGNYYKDARRKHFVEASWLRSEDGANGFSSHLGRLRKKAERLIYKVNEATMADSIRKYYQLSPKYPFQ